MAKRNTTKETKKNQTPAQEIPVQETPVKETPVQETPAPAPEKKETKEKTSRTIANNRTNGVFTLVRRNDNRIRLLSDGKTIALVQVGTKKSLICAAVKEVFDKLDEARKAQVVPVTNMGPNKFKLPVDTTEVDALARELFGDCEELIVEEKKEEKEG